MDGERVAAARLPPTSSALADIVERCPDDRGTASAIDRAIAARATGLVAWLCQTAASLDAAQGASSRITKRLRQLIGVMVDGRHLRGGSPGLADEPWTRGGVAG
jgi:hypothetical protein